MITARIPELGERVQMGKFATAFRGVWGQVVKIDDNPPVGPVLSKARRCSCRERGWREPYRNLHLDRPPLYNGKRVVIKASPYELDGGALDDRPVIVRGGETWQTTQ